MIPLSFVPLDPARKHSLLTWINDAKAMELIQQLEYAEIESELRIVELQREAIDNPDKHRDVVEATRDAQFYQRCRQVLVEIASDRFNLKQPINQIA